MPDYYLGVLSNQAAARGQGLWAPLSLSHPLDVVLVGAAIALAVRFSRSRPPAWELLASILLAAMTVQASRSGVWLLFFLMPSAARVFTSRRAWDHLLPVLGTLGLVALVFAIVRGPLPTGGSPAAVARAIALAHGTPVLAEAVQAEQVALAGGRIWVGNPIDAFSKRDQNTYLDWVEGRPSGHRALVSQVLVVLTGSRSPARRLMDETPDFVRVDAAPNAVIFLRRP
jgi:hypothetical protein